MMEQIDVLAFGAHPDDTELGCSGTLAKLATQGKRVVVVDLTRGEMGSRGTPETRMHEAKRAADILGLHDRINLGLPDTQLVNDRQTQLRIIDVVRRFRPSICLIGAPEDRHPDHGKATRLLLDALFYSGLRTLESRGLDGSIQEPHRPAHTLHYMQDTPIIPDLVMDITSTMEKKEAAIRAFATQFDVEEPGEEPETYISRPGFFETVRARARFFGHQGGFSFGEPFLYANGPLPLTTFDPLFKTTPMR
ncbi:MAG: bacillithiol biosynthesis deacetylase BshB1 [Balneolaceae bacterium]